MGWLRQGSLFVRRYLDSVAHLFWPELCYICRQEQPVPGDLSCIRCERELPYCRFPDPADNLLADRLTGRMEMCYGSALLFFREDGPVQTLLHQLKYQGRREIGTLLGRRHGQEWGELVAEDLPDAIVPVPLHPRRQRSRGYNQSACYAEGLSRSTGIPVLDKALVRTRYTTTQTHKSRSDRLRNVSEAFALPDPDHLIGKHLLIADDVFTSGATIEACAAQLLSVPGVRISVSAIAVADDW